MTEKGPGRSSDEVAKIGNDRISLSLLLFLLIIFSVLIIWLIWGNAPQDVSIIEGRVLTKFTPLDYDLGIIAERSKRGNIDAARDAFTNLVRYRSDQIQIEKAVSDQFPLRMTFIKASKALDRQVIKWTYAFLKDPATPTDMQSGFYVLRDGSAISSRSFPSRACRPRENVTCVPLASERRADTARPPTSVNHVSHVASSSGTRLTAGRESSREC